MSKVLRIDPREVVLTAIRAQGAGGQNVNKVSNAVHLRFDITTSSLPADVQARLRASGDQRITEDGVVVIKAQAHRSLGRNQSEALQRLQAMVDAAAAPPTPRRPTRPTAASRRRRLQDKAHRGELKAGRGGGEG